MDEHADPADGSSVASAGERPGETGPRARRGDRRRRPWRRADTRTGRPRAGAAPGTPGRARRTQLRRRRRRRLLLRALLGVLVVAALGAGVWLLGGFDRARELVAPDDGADVDALPGQRQPTLAVVTHDPSTTEPGPRHIALLAHDRETGAGTVLFVPPATIADVPGHGSFGVGEAFVFGQAPLAGVTLENLLGVRIDEVVGATPGDWAQLLDRFGPLTVEVPGPLVATDDGEGELRFEAGEQRLDGPRAAEYLGFREQGETELEVLPRLQRVLQALLDELAEDPDAARSRLVEGEAPLGVEEPEVVADLLVGLAEARAADEVAMVTLPVSPLGADRGDAYRVDEDRLGQLVEQRLAASRPDEGAGGARTLQILNGVGTPGVGQAVAERLQPGGYRVVLTGNADRFDHETTRVVVHGDEAEHVESARDVVERLGAGEIERSGTPQSVVDLTIVVGEDLLDAGLIDEAEQVPGRDAGDGGEEGDAAEDGDGG